jgi:hypothetical protein
MEERIELLWSYLENIVQVSEQTLHIITDINGYSVETLQDVLYVTTGYRSLEQLLETEELLDIKIK